MYYKPTDSHSYLLHSSSHPTHVKNSTPFSQFLRLRFLWSDESDLSNKSEEMLQFFKNRGYPDSVVMAAQQRAQTTDQQSAPQTSQNEENQRIHFTLTFQNDSETCRIFSLPPLISFKRNKNVTF